ncbi:MAG: NAD(P)-binding domain-containing protein [Cyanobacteriota bacterium]|nr:NAD(P)-binding domain-containing protein [Cyanobacteriota bacterium]
MNVKASLKPVWEGDYLIIGAGPGGLQLAYFLEKANLDYLILEAGKSSGTFFETYPRHKTLISINKVNTGIDDPELNLRWDWNSLLTDEGKPRFTDYSEEYFPKSDVMQQYLQDFAIAYDLKIRYNTKVIDISKEDEFTVTDKDGNQFRCRYLIVATGYSQQNLPTFEGVEYCETYGDVSLEPEDFRNQRVLIVGKGNSAFETAEHIHDKAASVHLWSPEPLKQSWDSHYVGHVRSVNSNLIDTYQLKAQNTINRGMVDKIIKKEKGYTAEISYTSADEKRVIDYDRVILCTGFKGDNSLFDDSCKIELDHGGKFPLMTSEWESTNIPNLYFAGTMMHSRDYKKTMSGFVHGFRYNVAALAQILKVKNHRIEWPCYEIPAKVDEIVDNIFRRINLSSAMFLQPGYFGDVMVRNDRKFQYYDDMAMDYVLEGEIGKSQSFYTITLEYGNSSGYELMTVDRDIEWKNAHQTGYLHPIIRYYEKGVLQREHHVFEDLENEWYLDRYIEPVREFYQQELKRHNRVAVLSR